MHTLFDIDKELLISGPVAAAVKVLYTKYLLPPTIFHLLLMKSLENSCSQVLCLMFEGFSPFPQPYCSLGFSGSYICCRWLKVALLNPIDIWTAISIRNTF